MHVLIPRCSRNLLILVDRQPRDLRGEIALSLPNIEILKCVSGMLGGILPLEPDAPQLQPFLSLWLVIDPCQNTCAPGQREPRPLQPAFGEPHTAGCLHILNLQPWNATMSAPRGMDMGAIRTALMDAIAAALPVAVVYFAGWAYLSSYLAEFGIDATQVEVPFSTVLVYAFRPLSYGWPQAWLFALVITLAVAISFREIPNWITGSGFVACCLIVYFSPFCHKGCRE